MNPYLVLGVPLQAGDQEIRQAYLAAIKVASPDTDPPRFQALSQAYEAIKDEPSRLRFYLFDKHCPANSPMDAFLRFARQQGRFAPLPLASMKEFLRSCAKA